MVVHGVQYRAHRIAWEITNGTIPDNLFVCHKCDTPPCVNPSHLFLGTHADNMQDRSNKNRMNAAYGERNGQAKLTSYDVELIRYQRKDGVSVKTVAKRFGIAQSHVYRITSREERSRG
jgi:hypothetical protein